MSEYDLSGLSSSVSSAATSMKNDFLDSLDPDFLKRVLSRDETITRFSGGSYRQAIDIVVDGIGSVDTLLQDAISNLQEFEIPEKPASLSEPIERDTEAIFISDQLDTIGVLLEEGYSHEVGNSGYSYDNAPTDKVQAVAKAMMTKEYELDADTLSVDVDTIANKWAADGYEVAPSALSFDVAQAINKFDNAREDKMISPVAAITNAIESSIKSAYENGISIERMQTEFAKKYTEFKYNKLDAEIKAYIGEVEKIQMEMSAPVMSISSILKAAKNDNDLDKSEAKLTLDRELNHFKNVVTASGSKAGATLGIKKANADLLATTTDGYVGLFSTYGSLFSGLNIQEQTVEEE